MRLSALSASVLIALCLLASLAGAQPGAPARSGLSGFSTAVFLGPGDDSDSHAARAMKRIREAGAKAVRLMIPWSKTAPFRRPAGFRADDPADPAYNWSRADKLISLAQENGLEPLVTTVRAPKWAGGLRVNAHQYGLFAKAIAQRYSGSFQDLPRVRYWIVWNEPNLAKYLAPQYSRGKLVSVARYRNMVNAFASSVRAVHRDNVVVAGITAPVRAAHAVGAFKFMRAVLCMSGAKRPKPTCRNKVSFDDWSVHPYTSGSPLHRAHGTDGVQLGDLPKVNRVLRAAVRAKHVRHVHRVNLWITEFSWDSRPPDPGGVRPRLLARWTAEALYRAKRAGVRVFTWFLVQDEPERTSPFQSGLYYRRGGYATRPKLVLQAFRFPFVALKQRRHVVVWGRTPAGDRRNVAVQRLVRGHWRRVAMIRSKPGGIFGRTLKMPRAKSSWRLRARLAGSKTHSLSFSLQKTPDRPLASAFGLK